MPKLKKSGKQYETPQVTPNNTATRVYGGNAPSPMDIQKSANARGGMRHEMKPQALADEEVLPESTQMVNNELVGIQDNGYLVKKELEYGPNVLYNSLPPGMDIEDQENADIRKQDMVIYSGGMSYPGDGWTSKQSGRQKDMGRPGKTNYVGKRGS